MSIQSTLENNKRGVGKTEMSLAVDEDEDITVEVGVEVEVELEDRGQLDKVMAGFSFSRVAKDSKAFITSVFPVPGLPEMNMLRPPHSQAEMPNR